MVISIYLFKLEILCYFFKFSYIIRSIKKKSTRILWFKSLYRFNFVIIFWILFFNLIFNFLFRFWLYSLINCLLVYWRKRLDYDSFFLSSLLFRLYRWWRCWFYYVVCIVLGDLLYFLPSTSHSTWSKEQII